VLYELELFECFLNLPEMNAPAENPLNMEWIRKQQQNDLELLARAMKYPERYVNKVVDGTKILCHVKPGASRRSRNAMEDCVATGDGSTNHKLVPSNSWPSWYNEDVPDIANKILPL
jgi:hypothetical protein